MKSSVEKICFFFTLLFCLSDFYSTEAQFSQYFFSLKERKTKVMSPCALKIVPVAVRVTIQMS